MATDALEHDLAPRWGAIGYSVWPSLHRMALPEAGGERHPAMVFHILDSLFSLAWDLAPGREVCHKA